MQDVGVFVPSMVIGDMLGAPREDADKLVDWTNRTTAFEDPRLVPDLGEVWRALEEFIPYVNAMIEDRAANPTDDLTTAFIQAEVDGERLSHEEVLMFFFLLMVAGNDSTRAVFTLGDQEPPRGPRADGACPRSGRCRWTRPSRSSSATTPPSRTCGAPPPATPRSAGQPVKAGDKLALWYVSATATRAPLTTRIASTSAAIPTPIRASAAAAGTSASAPALPAWS